VVRQVRQTLTFFSHSWVSSNALTTKRKEAGVNQGLEKIGKTRFATVWHGSASLEECLPLIWDLVSKGDVVVKGRLGLHFTGKKRILKLFHYYIASQ